MIRVLQFAGTINKHDFIDVIVRGVNPRRFEVGVCVGPGEPNIADPEYPPSVPRWTVGWRPRRDLHRAAFALARVLREWGADVLHTHHYDEAVIGMLATRLHRRTKLVVGRHYSDAIYRSAGGWKRRMLLTVESAVNRCASRIIVPSSFIRDLLTDRQGVPAAKVDLIPYGFAPEKYQAPDPEEVARLREDLCIGSRPCVGTFARLHEEKGHRFLVRAVAEVANEFPDCVFLFVGEGPERPGLERQVAEAGLGDRVRLLGWRKDVLALLTMVDVVVQPTLQEAFSQVMVEALWMGKPLVMADVSGTSDVIRDGETGLIVPVADAGAIARALRRLLPDAALRSRLGEAGREFVSDHLSIGRIIPRFEHVYEAICGN